MQSPEPGALEPGEGQQSNRVNSTPKSKKSTRGQMFIGIVSAGYIKTDLDDRMSFAASILLALAFSASCLISWERRPKAEENGSNLGFLIGVVVYILLSLLKPANVSIGKVSLKKHLTVACYLVQLGLVGAVFGYAGTHSGVCIILSLNLLNGLKIIAFSSVLCRVMVSGIAASLQTDDSWMQAAIILSNLDIFLQCLWIGYLISRPLKQKGLNLNLDKRKSGDPTPLRMKLLAQARQPKDIDTEPKELPQMRNDCQEKPYHDTKVIPRLSLPQLDSSRSKKHLSYHLVDHSGHEALASYDDSKHGSAKFLMNSRLDKKEIEYQINVPPQPTDSYRVLQIVQTDPEADTVKGKKSKELLSPTLKQMKHGSKQQVLAKASSFIMQSEKTPINRVNSFSPPNLNPDLLGAHQYMSPSMISIPPKSSDRKDLSTAIACLPSAPEAVQTSDALKSRVYAEYFEMIDELVLISDCKLGVIANNFNNNVEARTVKKMAKYFDKDILRQKSANRTLDAYFKCTDNHREVFMQCSEETLSSLRTIYEAFHYRHTKVSDRERYEKLKISNILGQLEEMSYQMRSQERAKTGRIREMGGEIVNMSKSMRSIRVGKATDCRYSIPEVLFLIREYLRLIRGKTLKYHFSNTLIFTFFFQENTQIKIRLVSLDSTFYLLLLAENISDKVELGEVNSKLNYSYMLMKSLSNELKTPVHHVIQVLKELEMLLEARASTDPPLLRTFEKFQQIAGGLDITVGNILDYASILNKTIQLKKTKFYLRAFLDELCCCFREKCKLKKISLQVDCDPELIMCTDYNRLRGVLFIFLENSVKFTDVGGINVKAEHISRNINFKVIDSGCGIKQKDLQVVSEILNNPISENTTKDAAGLGIGMRVASNILHLLQNNKSDLLNIDSKLNQGTTIQFEISQGIEEYDHTVTSLIDSDEYAASSQVMDEQFDTEKFEAKKIQFDIDRANLQAEHTQEPAGPFSLYLKKATMSMDSSRGKRRSFTEGDRAPKSNDVIKLMNAEVKREGFVRGIGSQTLRGINEMGVSPKSAINSPNRRPKIAAGLSLTASRFKKDSQKLTGTQSNNQEGNPDKKRLDSSESEPQSVDRKSQEAGNTRKKVLIVDDEIINLDFAKMALRSLGFKVYTAKKGEEAISKVEIMLKKQISLDLILMDYNMPKMTGDQVTRRLLDKKYESVVGSAVIFGLTAQTDQQTIRDCIAAGMHRVFSKPFDFFENKDLIMGSTNT